MREYLDVLIPLLQEGTVDYQGERYRTNASLAVPEAKTPPLVIAALGPGMLKLAGTRADGTTLWLTGPKTIADHTVPLLRQAAQEAGRRAPRVIAGMPVVLTDKPAQAREMVSRQLAPYSNIPSYRAMLDREGAKAPGDVALVGNEAELRRQFSTLADIGVTDLNAVLVNEDQATYESTLAFLADELKHDTTD
jgi:5,10-methylenetetrahydromethanopterin reductase